MAARRSAPRAVGHRADDVVPVHHHDHQLPLDPSSQQRDDLGDADGALVGPALGGVDPAQVGVPVELRERVEEGPGLGRGVQGGGDVGGQVAALGAFGVDRDLDRGAVGGVAVKVPRRAEHDARAPGASTTPRISQPPTVPATWWRAWGPRVVGVERDGHALVTELHHRPRDLVTKGDLTPNCRSAPGSRRHGLVPGRPGS